MNSGASAEAGESVVRADRRQRLAEALEHLTAALAILDENEVSSHVGARLDEAVHWLREEMGTVK